jgi:hypothetical protein
MKQKLFDVVFDDLQETKQNPDEEVNRISMEMSEEDLRLRLSHSDGYIPSPVDKLTTTVLGKTPKEIEDNDLASIYAGLSSEALKLNLPNARKKSTSKDRAKKKAKRKMAKISQRRNR